MKDGLDFLTELLDKGGLCYSAINTARSALSSFIVLMSGQNILFGAHPLVIRFLKAVYNIKPPDTKYQETWDINQVLNYLRTLPPVKELSLKDLTINEIDNVTSYFSNIKMSNLRFLNIKNMKRGVSRYSFMITDMLKQSRPGYIVKPLEFSAYPVNRKLCVYTVLNEYLKRTKHKRSSDYLLVSYIKPFGQVTTATISRWIKTVLHKSGIDVNVFKAHSVRSAAATKANARNVPLKDIMKLAGWTSESTFKKLYLKPVQKPRRSMSSALLE